jgi:hypothetical protein
MKALIVSIMALFTSALYSQNLQLHYDFGEDRKFYTATFEMFRPDTLGSTFWFIDFDFDFPGSPRSMSAAYFEFSREFYIPFLRKSDFFDQLTLHFEYNDGFTAYKEADELYAASYNSVFLAGFGHPINIGNFSIAAQWLIRLPRASESPDFQFTLVWAQPVFKNKVLITGFADLYSQDQLFETGKEIIFQAEPQLWYFFTPKLGAGTELEISKNFPFGPVPWKFRPTLAFRWEF